MIMDGYFTTMCSNINVKIYDNRVRIRKFNFDNYTNGYSTAKQFKYFNSAGREVKYKILKKNKQNKYKNYYHTTFINDGAWCNFIQKYNKNKHN
jgi:hypothetical protein